MSNEPNGLGDSFDLSFKIYYELMANRVSEILLVSSPYDAFIMEEDGRLAERIIHEYRGLNLTRPPRLTWVSTTKDAFEALSRKKFDLVLTMPRIDDMDPYTFGAKVKERFFNLPIFMLAHSTDNIRIDVDDLNRRGIDKVFVWMGNTDLLLAIIKSVEDQMNAFHDTENAMVRVVILVEDNAAYYSSMLPLLYKEIVTQTNAVMEESLNEEHRILRMRARPKILTAETFEEAKTLYNRYRPYLLSVFSDVRFPRGGKVDPDAGFNLLRKIKEKDPEMPLLMLSAEESNQERALDIPAIFLNKNSPALHEGIHSFFMEYLGFGDFVFRLSDGKEVARASTIREIERLLPTIPDDSILYHAVRNHFSSWLMARSEVQLASRLRPVKTSNFKNAQEIKEYLVERILERRKGRQRGVIADFTPDAFDPEVDFMKIGKGSLGGKARGLAFMTHQFRRNQNLQEKYDNVIITIPKTVVLSTEGFDAVVNDNKLKELIVCGCTDQHVIDLFYEARFPGWLRKTLKSYLSGVGYPIAVRSSSLMEDAQYQARAGVYSTYMLPNNHPDPEVRLLHLMRAIRLVYASTYLEKSRSFSKTSRQRTEEEKMAVVIQQLTGQRHGDYFYPALSGVAQSYNFYPISHMKAEEGIVHLAFGLGRTVVEGETSLRFSPSYPEFLAQFSSVEETLKNAQRHFYCLKMTDLPEDLNPAVQQTLARVEINTPSVKNHFPVQYLSSIYDQQDNRLRDSGFGSGYRVLTFASLLKYRSFPLAEIISDILRMGRQGMGCPVEIEFAMNLPPEKGEKAEFSLLQIRPMALSPRNMEVEIEASEIEGARCYSENAMGNGVFKNIEDIVFVKRESFDPSKTVEQAREIGRLNSKLARENRRYLLIGPGRWGSADPWLGIPVTWKDISGVGAIIEAAIESLRADPSQGSHFFHNITSLGISYITVVDKGKSFIDWDWLETLPPKEETTYLRHIQLEKPLTIKIDGKRSRALISDWVSDRVSD